MDQKKQENSEKNQELNRESLLTYVSEVESKYEEDRETLAKSTILSHNIINGDSTVKNLE